MMKLISAAIIALSVCVCSSQAQNRPHPFTVEVPDEGRACVTLVPKSGEIIFGQADSRGRVRFKNVPPGDYRLVVKTRGHGLWKRNITVGPDQKSYTFDGVIVLDGTEASRPSTQ